MSSKPRSYPPSRRNRVLTFFVMLAVLIVVAAPVYADHGGRDYYHEGQGVNCDWWALHEHWMPGIGDYWDHVGGVTSLQEGYDHICTQTHFEMDWIDHNDDYHNTHRYGLVAVNSGSFFNAQELYHTDHDVKSGSTWYGFRLYH